MPGIFAQRETIFNFQQLMGRFRTETFSRCFFPSHSSYHSQLECRGF